MSGWVPFDADGWPVIAEMLPRPWPREAVVFDLRWWADRERITEGRERRPGRVIMQERWGWTQWAYREVCRDEGSWRDPLRPPAAHAPPTGRPPAAHAPPACTRSDADDGEDAAHAPPTGRPPAAHRPPTGRPTRGVDTEHRTPSPPPTPESEHAPAREEPAWSSSDPFAEAPTGAPAASPTPSGTPTGATSATRPGFAPRGLPTASAPPVSPPATATTTEPHAHVIGRREPRDGGTAPTTADEAIVLGLALQRLQAHTPGARRIQGGSARALLAAHREGLTPDDLGAVCRWLDGAPGWAATLRERGQAVDSWAVVLGRDWRGLVAQARRWEADGCPAVEAARPPPTARGSPTARAGAGFGDALARLIEREEGQADVIDVEVWHGDEGGHREGVRAVAASGAGQARRLVDRARAGG